MAASSILIVTSDPVAAARLQEPLVAAGHGADVAETVEPTPESLRGRDVLILSGLGTEAAAEVCRRVKGASEGGRPGICVLTASDDVEARVALLQSGADEVLVESVDPRELEARIEALLVRFQRASPLVGGGTAARPRRSIAVFSPTGGVGTTTIAVNLGVTLIERYPGRVAIIDLHLPFGQVATHLDLRPTRYVSQLTADEPALRDPSQLVAYATPHPSGLVVYAAPPDWAPGPEMAPTAATAIVDTATLAHDRVVIDLGSATNERAVAVLSRADAIVLPVRPEIPALRAIRSLVEVLTEAGADVDRAVFVLNHPSGRDMILRPKDIETFLGRPPDAEVPYDPLLFVRSANEGIPVLTSAPTSAPAEALRRLAALVSGETPTAYPEPPVKEPERRSPGIFGGLFGPRG